METSDILQHLDNAIAARERARAMVLLLGHYQYDVWGVTVGYDHSVTIDVSYSSLRDIARHAKCRVRRSQSTPSMYTAVHNGCTIRAFRPQRGV